MVGERKCAAAAGLPQREQLPSRLGDAVSKPRRDRGMRKVGFVVRPAGGVVYTVVVSGRMGIASSQEQQLLEPPAHAGRRSLTCTTMADAGVVTQKQSGVILVAVPSADFRPAESVGPPRPRDRMTCRLSTSAARSGAYDARSRMQRAVGVSSPIDWSKLHGRSTIWPTLNKVTGYTAGGN